MVSLIYMLHSSSCFVVFQLPPFSLPLFFLGFFFLEEGGGGGGRVGFSIIAIYLLFNMSVLKEICSGPL